MSTNVGLFTAAGFRTPSPSATARVRCVLPAPSWPTSATTAPGNSNSPSRRAKASEASARSRGAVRPASLLLLVRLRRLVPEEGVHELVEVAVEHVLDRGR